MGFLPLYAKEIVSILVPVVTGIIRILTHARVRLTYSTPHGFSYIVQQPLRDADGNVLNPAQSVKTQSYYFTNAGRAVAHNVEMVFNWKPMTLNIWPVRHFTEHNEADNRYVLIFETLAPGEFLGCELLTVNAEMPMLITFRCDEGNGKNVRMYPQPIIAKPVVFTALAIMFVGLAASVYLMLVGLQILILKTPTIL